MSEQTASDASESAPGVERTSVLALDVPESEDVRRALVLLAGLRGRTLAPLVRSGAVPGGVALTHRVPADAVGLASLRADGPLRAGHVLAVGVAVLEALVTLHTTRLAHGRVDGESVLVAPDGSVVLAATGAAWTAAPGEHGGPSPADDVAAVGELLRDLLGPGSAPAPLVVAVVRAVDPDLALRPDAAALLAALHRCGRPESLLDALWSPSHVGSEAVVPPSRPAALPGAATPDLAAERPASADLPARPSSLRASRQAPRPARSRRRSRSGSPAASRAASPWRLFAVAVLAVGVVAGALAAAGRGGRVDAPSSAVAATQPAPISATPTAPARVPSLPSPWADVAWDVMLAELDRGRTAALAAGSPQQLRAWVTGTAYAADVALARSVAAAGARIEGGGLVLEEVAPVSVDATSAVLRVRDRRSAYAVVADGIRQEVPERAQRTWTVTLVRGGSPTRWRIAEVVDATLSPGGRR